MTKPALTEVLEAVNRIRAEHGKKPLKRMPKGRIGVAASCPVACALRPLAEHVEVSSGEIEWWDGDPDVWDAAARGGLSYLRTPRKLGRFIEAFDAGEYPELVK